MISPCLGIVGLSSVLPIPVNGTEIPLYFTTNEILRNRHDGAIFFVFRDGNLERVLEKNPELGTGI